MASADDVGGGASSTGASCRRGERRASCDDTDDVNEPRGDACLDRGDDVFDLFDAVNNTKHVEKKQIINFPLVVDGCKPSFFCALKNSR